MPPELALRDTTRSPRLEIQPDSVTTIVVVDAIRSRPAVNEPPRAPRYHGHHDAFAWLLDEATVFTAPIEY